MKKYLIALVVLILGVGVLFAAPGANWSNGGWVISDSYTNPNPTAGSEVGTLTGTVNYTIDGNSLPESVSEAVTLKAGEIVITKRWVSTEALSAKYAISEVTGGTASFDATGKLVYTISAPNDGNAHSISFKLKPIGASWVAQLPIVRNYALTRVAFSAS
jgi:hypothetical protein